MSAPLRPAAWTRTSSSPACGSGSGCSWTAILPSRIVAARTVAMLLAARLRRPAHEDCPFGGCTAGPCDGVIPANGMRIPHVPPLWRESRIGVGGRAAAAQPGLARGGRRRPATARPVLLVPGFLAGDGSLGDDDQVAARQRLLDAAEPGSAPTSAARRRPASASRSGWRRWRSARASASRSSARAAAACSRGWSPTGAPTSCPGSSTLGAPTVSMLTVHPLVLLQVGVVGALGTGRVPGLLSLSCLRGACCEGFRADLPAAFPAERPLRVGLLALGRDRRLARLPGPGRRPARRGPRLALRHGASASGVYRLARARTLRARSPGTSRPGWPLAAWPRRCLEQRDALDVRRLREHVDRADARRAGSPPRPSARRSAPAWSGCRRRRRSADGCASMIRRTTFCDRPARGGSTTATSGRPACSTSSRIASRMSPA